MLAAQAHNRHAREEYDGMLEDCPEADDGLDSNMEEAFDDAAQASSSFPLIHIETRTVLACVAACIHTTAFFNVK